MGASGAIAGVLGAYLVLFPRNRVYVFFLYTVISVPAFLVLAIWAVTQFISLTGFTASYDLHDKKEAYRRNGVLEYLVWRVEDHAIDWFVLRGGSYGRLEQDEDGIYRSGVFPGLWLDAPDLLDGNMLRVLEILGQGLASPEHAQFLRQLRDRD